MVAETFFRVTLCSGCGNKLQIIKYSCATFCTLTVKQKLCCVTSLVVTVGLVA